MMSYFASSSSYSNTFLVSAFTISQKKVHNMFGGMRDLAIFCGDTRDASYKKGERKAGILTINLVPRVLSRSMREPWERGCLIMSGSGISYFYWVGMRES